MLNPDYKEMLSLLLEKEVEFLLVGAFALAAHGFPRATGDIDIFVNPTKANSEKVFRCLAEFGAPLHDVTAEDFSLPGIIFQIGIAPRRIDIISLIDGVTFEEGIEDAVEVVIDGLRIPVLSKPKLIKNKESTGRLKDQVDADNLRSSLAPYK